MMPIHARSAMPFVLVALAALGACSREPPPPGPPAAKPVPSASPTAPAGPATATAQRPALRIATLDGGIFDLAAQRGKWVIVNFWATWCGPCLKEMPELSALDAMREHIVVVGLAYEDTTTEALLEFMGRHPVVYPIALLDVYDPPGDFETPRGLPTTYVIAPDGTVAKKYTGPVTARMIEEDIAVAGGPAPGEAVPDEGARAGGSGRG